MNEFVTYGLVAAASAAAGFVWGRLTATPDPADPPPARVTHTATSPTLPDVDTPPYRPTANGALYGQATTGPAPSQEARRG